MIFICVVEKWIAGGPAKEHKLSELRNLMLDFDFNSTSDLDLRGSLELMTIIDVLRLMSGLLN